MKSKKEGRKIEVNGKTFKEIKSITIDWDSSEDGVFIIQYIESCLPDVQIRLIDCGVAKLDPKKTKNLFFWTDAFFFNGAIMTISSIATDSGHTMSLHGFPLETGLLVPHIVDIEDIKKYKYQDSLDVVSSLTFDPQKRYFIDGQIKEGKIVLNIKEEVSGTTLYSIEFNDELDAVAWTSRALKIKPIKYGDINSTSFSPKKP